MTTTTMTEIGRRTEESQLDDHEWLRRMTALYNCLTRNEVESLIAWEHQQIARTGLMRTADWPGWEQRLGPRPSKNN